MGVVVVGCHTIYTILDPLVFGIHWGKYFARFWQPGGGWKTGIKVGVLFLSLGGSSLLIRTNTLAHVCCNISMFISFIHWTCFNFPLKYVHGLGLGIRDMYLLYLLRPECEYREYVLQAKDPKRVQCFYDVSTFQFPSFSFWNTIWINPTIGQMDFFIHEGSKCMCKCQIILRVIALKYQKRPF